MEMTLETNQKRGFHFTTKGNIILEKYFVYVNAYKYAQNFNLWEDGSLNVLGNDKILSLYFKAETLF